MLNTLLTSFSENLAVLVVLLLWFIWFQTRWHRDMTSLRKKISDVKDELRKDMGTQGERLARIEGLLTRGTVYDAVAEPPVGSGPR